MMLQKHLLIKGLLFLKGFKNYIKSNGFNIDLAGKLRRHIFICGVNINVSHMEDRYSKFKKLNWLLTSSFDAERIYYNASEDVQEVGLKRFFSHQSVNRNRFSYEISEYLVQAGIEPKTKWAKKGNTHRNWWQEKKVLTKNRPLKYLKKCRLRDEQNLELYDEILEEKRLSKEILKTLKKQKHSILKSLEEAEKFQTREVPLTPENRPKVRKLKAI